MITILASYFFGIAAYLSVMAQFILFAKASDAGHKLGRRIFVISALIIGCFLLFKLYRMKSLILYYSPGSAIHPIVSLTYILILQIMAMFAGSRIRNISIWKRALAFVAFCYFLNVLELMRYTEIEWMHVFYPFGYVMWGTILLSTTIIYVLVETTPAFMVAYSVLLVLTIVVIFRDRQIIWKRKPRVVNSTTNS